MQLVAVDILGPFLESEAGNLYNNIIILTVGDYFTCWMEIPYPNKEAQKYHRRSFLSISPMHQSSYIQTKDLQQFESSRYLESTRPEPQPITHNLMAWLRGTIEPWIAVNAATDNPFDGEYHLRPLCMAYNTSVNPTTGYSPFFLMFGCQVQMPIDVMYGQPRACSQTTWTTGVCLPSCEGADGPQIGSAESIYDKQPY